jgi:hypothetical protein
MEENYQFVEVPTPLLTSHHRVGHSMSRLEVPVQMGSLLLLAYLIGMEASSALIARCAEFLVEVGDKMRSGSDQR